MTGLGAIIQPGSRRWRAGRFQLGSICAVLRGGTRVNVDDMDEMFGGVGFSDFFRTVFGME